MPQPIVFVIHPMDSRADDVVDIYFSQALQDKYSVIQINAEPSDSIIREVRDHLKNDPVVIAFLSSPGRSKESNGWFWNPNVMFHSGYRIGLGKPIIFVREARAEENNEPFLPFGLVDCTVIELPKEEKDPAYVSRRRETRRKIRENVDRVFVPVPTPIDIYTYPAVTMAFDGGSGGTITAASTDASTFFRYPSGKNIVGTSILDLVGKLTSEMEASQRQAFSQEQERLIGQVFAGSRPLATVCIVFGKPKDDGSFDNAYLPIITRFRATAGEPTTLEVVYLDVSANAVIDDRDGVVKCNLGMARAAAVGRNLR